MCQTQAAGGLRPAPSKPEGHSGLANEDFNLGRRSETPDRGRMAGAYRLCRRVRPREVEAVRI